MGDVNSGTSWDSESGDCVELCQLLKQQMNGQHSRVIDSETELRMED